MNFKDTITTLAENQWQLDLSFSQAMKIANLLSTEDESLVYTLDLRTIEKRAAFANTLPEVRQAFWDNQRITAIKALRDASKGSHVLLPDTSSRGILGLKDAKDAIDALWLTGLTNLSV